MAEGSGMCKKALIIATVGGFLPKFEMGNARILQQLGYEVHYAANLQNPVYRFDAGELKDAGIRLHDIAIDKSPFALGAHRRALEELVALIGTERISLIHCHTPVGGYLGRMAGKKVQNYYRAGDVQRGYPGRMEGQRIRSCGNGGANPAWRRTSGVEGTVGEMAETYERESRNEMGNSGIRVIYTAHGFHFYKGAPFPEGIVFKCVEKYLARFTDVLVTINKEDYENACRFRLKPGGKVFRIPGVGLDMEKFHPPTEMERRECRKRLGISEETFFLLSVGELNRNKNHRVVLEAMSLMRAENGGVALNGKRLLYGICGEGGARVELEAEIQKFDLGKEVRLYGYQDPHPYLAAADAFIFPSRREGLGMAALEALAMGVPVIAADNRGSREYMQSGENGYVFAWNDPSGCAAAMRFLLGMAPQELAQMGRFCRESVKAFDVRETEAVMREVYRGVAGRE